MNNLTKGGLIAVAAVVFAFVGAQSALGKNTVAADNSAKSFITGKMSAADAQQVAQAAIPRAQATTTPAQQQTADAKAKQAQQAARQQQLLRQQQLRQQQAARQQQLRQQQVAGQQKEVAAVAQKEVETTEEPAEAFAAFEATFVAPDVVENVSAAMEQSEQNVTETEEVLSPSAPR